jgi:23S rRNA (uridine2552-2'-O)-methyltransferase
MTRPKRSSSRRWRERQEADPFVHRARQGGFRARAVFKLEEIDRRERLLRRGMICVDLGASPGSWSQYAAAKIGNGGRVVAIDLLPMDPVPDVDFILGDFLDPAVAAELGARCGARAVDLVMSDLAPNISGNRVIDQGRSLTLAEEALEFAAAVLKPGGSFLVKLFQGSGIDEFVTLCRARFARVKLVKPRASRAGSREIYLLAREYTL